MSVEQVVFYIVAVVAVVGALGVVLSRDIVHSALFLIFVLLMTASVFVLLSSEFLALAQILVYGGGITILVIFALMITTITTTKRLYQVTWLVVAVCGVCGLARRIWQFSGVSRPSGSLV